MANEKPDDVLKANGSAPEALIPDLKKKEKERKKAGAAWSRAGGAASDFSGATGGTVARAAASAAAEAGMVGAEGGLEGGIWAAISRFFAGMMATVLGRIAVAAAVLLMAGVAALVGYSLFKGGGNTAGTGTPDLGGITDSMRVREGGRDRFDVAGKGEIRFDPQAPAKPAPPPEPPKAVEEKPAPEKAVEPPADKPVPSGQLAHNMSGAQLSSSLGGNFGSKNIFTGNSFAPKFNTNASKLPIGGFKGKLGAMKPSTLHGNAMAQTVTKGSSNRALGQLKLTKGISAQGIDAPSAEGAATAASDAFDQQQTVGGGLTTPGAPGGDSVVPPGTGAPPDTGSGATPPTPPGGGTDPGLQNTLAQISSLANEAMANIQMGTMMMMLGAILIGIGIAIGMPWGLALIAAGIALIVMGLMKIQEGKAEEAQAIAMGQQLAAQINDMQQGAAVTYCTQQAVASGTPVQSCNPPESITNANTEAAQDTTDIQTVKTINSGATATPTINNIGGNSN